MFNKLRTVIYHIDDLAKLIAVNAIGLLKVPGNYIHIIYLIQF